MIDVSANREVNARVNLPDKEALDSFHAALLAGQVFETMGLLNRSLRLSRSAMSRPEWISFIEEHLSSHAVRALLRQSPFSWRASAKPRGYAGDAVMIDLIYNGLSSLDANRKLDEAICNYELSTQSCVAVRDRRDYASNRVSEYGRRKGSRILSVACGHLREITTSALASFSTDCQIVAIDQDPVSLATVSAELPDDRVSPNNSSVADLLSGKADLGTFDFIYTLGLYDYLEQRVARLLTKRLTNMLRPRGELLIANFAPELLDVGYMEAIMDWWLVYRDEALFADVLSGIDASSYSNAQIFRDPHEVIVYVNIRK